MTPLHTVIACFAVLWLSLAGCYCYLLARPSRKARTRNRRRGGYIRPPQSASSRGNRAATFTTSATPTVAGNGSLSTGRGDPSGGLATRLTQPSANRTTARISSTDARDGHPGRTTTTAEAA